MVNDKTETYNTGHIEGINIYNGEVYNAITAFRQRFDDNIRKDRCVTNVMFWLNCGLITVFSSCLIMLVIV